MSSAKAGVRWHADKKRWFAYVETAGKVQMVGKFKTEQEAQRAFESATRKYKTDS